MARKYFGQWLLERSLLSTDTLLAGITLQKDSNKPLGELGIELGYLTALQVRAITQEQNRTDSFFGEIAVGKRMITEDQLNELLAMQKNRRIFLGEALVRLRGINKDVMDKELQLFLENNREEEALLHQQLNSLDNSAVVKKFVDTTITMLQRIIRVTVKLAEIHAAPRQDNNLRYTISQRVEGVVIFDRAGQDSKKEKAKKTHVIFNLALPDRLILLVASSLLAIEQTELNEFTIDTAVSYVVAIARNASEKLGCDPRRAVANAPQLLDLERLGAPIPCHACLLLSSLKGDFQINILFV